LAPPQRAFSILAFCCPLPSLHQHQTIALQTLAPTIITSTPDSRSSNSRYYLISGSLRFSLRTHTPLSTPRHILNSRLLGLSNSIPHISSINHRGNSSAMAKSNISNQTNNNKRSLAMSVAASKANVMASCYAVEAATGGLAAFHYCSSSRAGGMHTHISRVTRSKTNDSFRS